MCPSNIACIASKRTFCGILYGLFIAGIVQLCSLDGLGQINQRPTLAAGKLSESIRVDGRLDEFHWQNAPVLDEFLTTVPQEQGQPSASTKVRVLANSKFIVIGIECEDLNPEQNCKIFKNSRRRYIK